MPPYRQELDTETRNRDSKTHQDQIPLLPSPEKRENLYSSENRESGKRE